MSVCRFARYLVIGAAFSVATVAIASNASASSRALRSAKASKSYAGVVVRVGGFLLGSSFAGADVGAEARFAAANASGELAGARIDYVGTTNDTGDPASALSALRQMVEQEKVQVIVPDLSPDNNLQFLESQKIPYVGAGYDSTFCATSTSQILWGFGYIGCLVPSNPPFVPDSYGLTYKYVTSKLGQKHPTMAVVSNDNQSGMDAAKFQASAAQGAGFTVVYAKGDVPTTVSDYSPYVTNWLSSARGKQPNVITCLIAAQCIDVYAALKASGFKGIFFHTLGDIPALAKSFAGSVSAALYNPAPSPAYTQMQNQIEAFKPGTALTSYSVLPSYFSADMFVRALKSLEKAGKTLTSTNIRQQLDHQTWQIPGLGGPTVYPRAGIARTPACSALVQYAADGSGAQVVEPYTCSLKTFRVDPHL